MSTFFERNARRLLIAGGLALCMGVPTIACMGGDEAVEAPEPAPGGGKDKKAKKPAPAKPEAKILGTWQMRPPESELRNLKIIDAALTPAPQKMKKLGKLSASEQKLFDDTKKLQGDARKMAQNQIKFMKQSKFTFTDSDVTVQFGPDDKFGPSKYTVVSASDAKITVKFDPGLGNGMETHAIEWKGKNKGTDHISAGGMDFIPLDIAKIPGK